MPGHARNIKLFVARIFMAFSFHMIYNIDIRSVFCVISCPNKMGFAATNIRNIVFVHECYLYLWLMMKWRRKIIECALSSRKVDPPITTFLIFVANALTYQNHTTQFFTTLYQCHEKAARNCIQSLTQTPHQTISYRTMQYKNDTIQYKVILLNS